MDLFSNTQLMVASYLIPAMFFLFILFYLVVKIKPSQFRTAFAATQAVTLLWLFFALCERVVPTFAESLFNIRGNLVCINFMAPMWLITMLYYTERLSRKNRWLFALILAVPCVLSLPLFFPVSSDMFKLYIEEVLPYKRFNGLDYEGPLEKATGVTALCCTIVIFCFLFGWFRKNSSVKPVEKAAMLFALWLPIVLHYIKLSSDVSLDLTPLAFSLLSIVMIYLAHKRQFFNATSPLVWNVFNVTKESMAVIGADGLVNVNEKFIAAFGNREGDFLAFADEISDELSLYIQERREIGSIAAEKNGAFYEISVKNVMGSRGKILGQLITITDVSEAKKLALAKERARIASTVHDNMGNRLIASINNTNLAMQKPTLAEAKPFMELAADSTAASLMMLRKMVEGLTPVNFNETRLVPMIRSVINRTSAAGTCADLEILGDLEALPTSLKEFVYDSCQEALTNAVIHGKAEEIVIKLEISAGMLRMEMVDNGLGCDKIYKNNGLNAMEGCAEKLGGGIRFRSRANGGFEIRAEIPIY